MLSITHYRINGTLYALSPTVVTDMALDVRFPTSLSGDGTDAMYDITILLSGFHVLIDVLQEHRMRLLVGVCLSFHGGRISRWLWTGANFRE